MHGVSLNSPTPWHTSHLSRNCKRRVGRSARALASRGGRFMIDGVTQAKERVARQRLGEEVSHVGHGGYERDDELLVLHQLAHVNVMALDVLGLLVMLRVVGAGRAPPCCRWRARSAAAP
eukprot:4559083-Prymnesium_polylepis.1